MATFDVDSKNLGMLHFIYKVFKTKSLSEQLLPITWQLPFQAQGDQTGPKQRKTHLPKLWRHQPFFVRVFFVCVSNTFSLRFWHFCWKLCPHAFHFSVTAGFPSLKPVHWAHLSCTLRMACATIKQVFDHWAVNLARAKDALAWNNLLLASYPWSWQFTKERSLLECCKLFNSFKFNKKVKLFCTLKTCIIKFRI